MNLAISFFDWDKRKICPVGLISRYELTQLVTNRRLSAELVDRYGSENRVETATVYVGFYLYDEVFVLAWKLFSLYSVFRI